MRNISNELEEVARVSSEEKLRLKDAILKLEREKKELLDERPENYLKLKYQINHAAKQTTKLASQVCLLM